MSDARLLESATPALLLEDGGFRALESYTPGALTPVAGSAARYDASNAGSFTYSSGVSVSQWNDLSGNDRHLTALSSGDEPDRNAILNGLTAVHFDGAAWMAANTYTPPAQPYTLQIAVRSDINQSDKWLTGDEDQIGRHSFFGADAIVFQAGNAVGYTGYNGAEVHVITAVFNGALSVQRVNGVQVGAAALGTNSIGHLWIGKPTGKPLMDMGELLFYERVLSPAEIAQNESYLTAKWQPSWDFDFTDDPDGVPAGWTTVQGTEVGPATVISGLYKCPQLYWRSKVRYDTPVTTTWRRVTGEFAYVNVTDNHTVTAQFLDGTNTTVAGFELNQGGTWSFIDQQGYKGPSGTWTPPGVGIPFIVALEAHGNVFTATLNGTTLATYTFGGGADDFGAAVLPYAGADMQGAAGMRKWADDNLAGAPATVPGAPTSVAGTAGNGQVSLTWTAPASNGGSAITDYVVQYALNSAPTSWTTFSEATSTATAATVTGLTNETAYIFRVAAVNAVGTGAYSTASSPVTPSTFLGPHIVGTPTANGGVAGNTLTINKPAGAAVGETLVIVMYMSSFISGIPWTTACPGFTDEASYNSPGTGGGRSISFAVLVRPVNGSEGSTFTVTTTSPGSSDPFLEAVCFRVDNLITVIDGQGDVGLSTTGNLQDVTVLANTLVFGAVAGWSSALIPTPPAGWVDAMGTGDPAARLFTMQQAAAATVPDTAFTWSGTEYWNSFTFGLAPPVPTWEYDFGVLGAPTGWTKASGTGALVVTGGALTSDTAFFAMDARENVAVTTNVFRIKAEMVRVSGDGDDFIFWFMGTADHATHRGISLNDAGGVTAVYQGGGAAVGSGAWWTPLGGQPALGVPFLVEINYDAGNFTLAVGGTVIRTDNFNTLGGGVGAETGFYGGISLNANSGLRKWTYTDVVVYSDNFNRANAAAPGLGSGWDTFTWGIVSNRAVKTLTGGGGGDYARFQTNVGSLDHWVEADIVGPLGSGQYVVINGRTTNPGVGVGLGGNAILGFIRSPGDGGQAVIGRMIDYSYGDLAVGPATPDTSGTFKLRLECQGDTYRLYHNGTLVQSVTSTDTSTQKDGYTGLNMNDAASTGGRAVDNFRCAPLPYMP